MHIDPALLIAGVLVNRCFVRCALYGCQRLGRANRDGAMHVIGRLRAVTAARLVRQHELAVTVAPAVNLGVGRSGKG